MTQVNSIQGFVEVDVISLNRIESHLNAPMIFFVTIEIDTVAAGAADLVCTFQVRRFV